MLTCENGPVRLLIVEDDKALGAVLRRGLVDESYAVDLVGTVAGAEEAVAINQYDAVVLDLGLPDGDGAQLCRAWRDRGLTVPVLMLTARSSLNDKVGGLDSGADDFLSKPFDFPELTARLRALLRRPAELLATVLRVGDLELDPARCQVCQGEVVIPVTAKELAVLAMLMRHNGKVVSKTDLLEHCWDEHYDGLSNVVEVHIASLRRKLERPGQPAPIETLRGSGYRFVALSGVSS